MFIWITKIWRWILSDESNPKQMTKIQGEEEGVKWENECDLNNIEKFDEVKLRGKRGRN